MPPYSPLVISLEDIEPNTIEHSLQSKEKIQYIFAQAKAKKDLHAQFLALMYLARVAWHQNQFENGLALCKQAKELITPELENDYLAELYHTFAKQYWGLERFRSAHKFWNLSLEKALIFKCYRIQVECLIGIGNAWRTTKNLNYAYAALSFSMMLAEQLSYKILAGKSAILLAWVLAESKQYNLMLDILKRAQYLLKNNSDIAWQAEIEALRSFAFLHLDKTQIAKSIADAAHLIAIKSNAPWIQTKISLIAASIAINNNQGSLARNHLDHAELNALKFNQLELLSELYYSRFELEERSNLLEKALFYFKKHSKYLSILLRSRSASMGLDDSVYQQSALNYKTELLIDRLEDSFFSKFESKYKALKDPIIWLHYCSLAQKNNTERVYIITLNDSKKRATVLSLIDSLCLKNEVISLFGNQLAMLLQTPLNQSDNISQTFTKLLIDYPWWRLGLIPESFNIHSLLASDFLQNKEDYLNMLSKKK